MFLVVKRRSVTALTAAISFTISFHGLASAQPPPPPAGGAPQAGKIAPPPLPPALQRVSDQYSAAVKLHSQKKYPEAIAAYELFVKMATAENARPPAFLAAYTNMASIYQVTSDKKNYQATLNKIVSLDPKDFRAWAQLAIIASSDHAYDKAATYSNKVLGLNPPPDVASSAHFVKGNVAVARKDFQGAAREFGQSARLMPKNPLSHFNYGLALAELKRYKEAEPELEAAVQLDPANTKVRDYLAKLKDFIAKQPSKSAGSETAYDAILKKDPHNAAALLGRAKQLDSMKRSVEATSAYIEAIAASPENYDAHFNLAKLYENSGTWVPAKDHFSKAHLIAEKAKNASKDALALGELANTELGEALKLQDPKQREQALVIAETHANQAIALAPNDLDQKSRLGRIYEQQRRFKDAEALYRTALVKSPGNLGIYIRIAGTYQSRADVPGFVKVWREYQAIKPDDPTSYEYIADVYNRTRDFKSAVAALKELLTRNLSNSLAAAAHVIMGQDLIELNQFADATEELKKVLALTPSNTGPAMQLQEKSNLEAEQRTALKSLAGISAKQNKFTEAIGYLNELKRREASMPSQPGSTLKGESYRDIAVLYERANKPELAIKEYEAMAVAVPNDPVPHEEMGRVLEQLKKIEQAVAQYRIASKLSTKDPVPDRIKIAEAYQRSHMLDKAVAELESLYKENLKNVPVMTSLALAYQQSRQDLKALEIYDAIMKVDPTQQWVQDKRAVTLAHLGRFAEAEKVYKDELERAKTVATRQTYADLLNIYKEEKREEQFLAYVKPRFEQTPANATVMAVVYDEYVRQNKETEGQAYISGVIAKAQLMRKTALATYAGILQGHMHADMSLEIHRQLAKESPKDIATQIDLADQLDFNNLRDEANGVFVGQIARTDITRDQRINLRRQLALRYVQQKKLTEARATYEAQFKDDPIDFDSSMRLGDVIEKLGELDQAAAFYRRLLSLPTYPALVRKDIHLRTGAIYEKLNKTADALAEYKEVLKLEPDDTVASAAIKKLGG